MGNNPIRYRRNRRKGRLKKNATNEFTAFTGAPAIQLSGGSNCLVTSLQKHERVPSRKIAYAVHHGWQPYEMAHTARRMKLLRVKQACGVDQCVNPNHLVGDEKEFKPWG